MKNFIVIITLCLFSVLLVNSSNAFATCNINSESGHDGLFKIYNKDGKLKKTNPYIVGKIAGIETLYDETLSEGAKKNGVNKGYYKNGKRMIEVPYKDGKVDGVKKVYYKNGKIWYEIPYLAGKKEGISRIYYENGKISSEALYKNGKVDGIAKSYHENGKLKQEIPFDKQGLLDGELQVYDEKGKIILAITCVADSPVSGICYKKDSTTRALTKEELKDWHRREIMPKCD
ncbi:toxin-antitoxin system YwqK family antitoxin [Desulfovibrio litoralis]|uniref:Antitoxin component YwqK of the YwqJK toxin-antitoxin module n=1 Tax=Desulfovibrio litoralis DSM 11393 TaxID=1121455 RepID=A0A1M7TFV9_9BACT|nr:toxin-antitoxin system YwqK family antitoxin [Desulfovibrio litoralis]SHN69585.1 Antitoxin component YwqK of the YwqJK toxin-antitoxin module [Desulfovibrio litoralis DSM 11393]